MAGKGRGKGIAHWPQAERPRERLLAKGSEALSDANLLAILLRTGRRDASAVQVALELLGRMGGLGGLAACGTEELCTIPGIGPAKAAQLKAAGIRAETDWGKGWSYCLASCTRQVFP